MNYKSKWELVFAGKKKKDWTLFSVTKGVKERRKRGGGSTKRIAYNFLFFLCLYLYYLFGFWGIGT